MNDVFPCPAFSAMDFPPELHDILALDTEADVEHWKNDKRFDEILSAMWERGLLDPPAVYFDFVEWWNEPDPREIIEKQCNNSLFGHWHHHNMGMHFICACSQVLSQAIFQILQLITILYSNSPKSRTARLWFTESDLTTPSLRLPTVSAPGLGRSLGRRTLLISWSRSSFTIEPTSSGQINIRWRHRRLCVLWRWRCRLFISSSPSATRRTVTGKFHFLLVCVHICTSRDCWDSILCGSCGSCGVFTSVLFHLPPINSTHDDAGLLSL